MAIIMHVAVVPFVGTDISDQGAMFAATVVV